MNIFPIKSNFIDEILLFKKISIPPNHYKQTSSTPSHLFHYIIKGSYQLMIQRREYSVSQGQIIYYEDSEEVIWLKNDHAVDFYSIAFKSNYFQIPDILNRVQKVPKYIGTLFQKIEALTLEPKNHQKFQIFNKTSELIYELFKNQINNKTFDEKRNTWVDAEIYLQRNHLYQINLETLAKKISTSTATLRRDCHKKFGLSPLKRMQLRRMEAAKGLLIYTPLQIKQIADQLGYERLHEFSREFSKYFKTPPSEFRLKNN